MKLSSTARSHLSRSVTPRSSKQLMRSFTTTSQMPSISNLKFKIRVLTLETAFPTSLEIFEGLLGSSFQSNLTDYQAKFKSEPKATSLRKLMVKWSMISSKNWRFTIKLYSKQAKSNFPRTFGNSELMWVIMSLNLDCISALLFGTWRQNWPSISSTEYFCTSL